MATTLYEKDRHIFSSSVSDIIFMQRETRYPNLYFMLHSLLDIFSDFI